MSEKLKQRRIAKGRGRALPVDRGGDSIEKQLAYVAEVSKNARTTWFGLIGLLLFCGVTLLDVQDRDFFEYGVSTQLPLIGVSVPTKNFFWAAPLLVTGLFTYLHLYLDKLWKALAPLDNEIDGKPVTQVVYPWLISDTALEMRAGVLRGPYWFITRFVTLCLCWLVGPLTLFLFWIKSWAPHDEWLTTVIGLQLVWLVMVAAHSWIAMERMAGETRPEPVRGAHAVSAAVFAVLAWGIGAYGWAKTEHGGVWAPAGYPDAEMAFLYSAQLYQANFVKPDRNWKGRDRALREYERKNRKDVITELTRDGNAPDEATVSKYLLAEFREARSEDRSALDREDRLSLDLRGAYLAEAFLAGFDLIGARLEGATLKGARLEGAFLRGAKLDGADLSLARLEGADLTAASVIGANLGRARLEEAELRRADLESASLRLARLDGANLWGARLENADLTRARLDMANLWGIKMNRVVVQHTSIIGATLRNIQNLSQAQLDLMYGDGSTDLDGTDLTPPSHWPSILIPEVQRTACWREWALLRRAMPWWVPQTDVICTTHGDRN